MVKKMTKPIQIGRMAFRRKMDAEAHIKGILDTSTWGVPLLGEIHEFVLSLLYRHPRSTEKIGTGISHFTVNSDGNGDRCFYVHRPGESPQHFSYVKSLNGRDDTRSLVLGALNRAIDEQVWAFRDAELARGPQYCPYKGVLITKDQYHVDHPNPTFFELHTAWFAVTGLQYEEIKLSAGSGNEIGRNMTDAAQKLSWQDYHQAHAQLRLLSPRANLSDAKIEANARMRDKRAV
jgi:hypothetical protein